MRISQAAITRDFDIETPRLTTEGTLYNITIFCDQVVALQLPSLQCIVPHSSILGTNFNAACFQSIAMFLAAIRFADWIVALSIKPSNSLLSWQLSVVNITASTNPSPLTTYVACTQIPDGRLF